MSRTKRLKDFYRKYTVQKGPATIRELVEVFNTKYKHGTNHWVLCSLIGNDKKMIPVDTEKLKSFYGGNYDSVRWVFFDE